MKLVREDGGEVKIEDSGDNITMIEESNDEEQGG